DGRWRASIQEFGQAPQSISVTTSDGCTVDQQVTLNRREGYRSSNRDHHGDDEHDYGSGYRIRSQSSREDD
ncbi:MAG: hypothetical protein P8130_08230, partial [Deltaproteobacteria bacterium]